MAKSKIIKELANNEISIDVAISRVLIIASDIGNEELARWAEKELNGYTDKDVLPDYRIAKNTQFLTSGIVGNLKFTNSPIALERIVGHPLPAYIADGVRTIEGIVTNGAEAEYGRDLSSYSGLVLQKTGRPCYSITQTVSHTTFSGILNNIKTILLKILLELDKTFGNLDDLDIDVSGKNPDEIQKVNQTIINIIIDKHVEIGDKNKIDGSILGSENEQ
jgi:hypothetical protein